MFQSKQLSLTSITSSDSIQPPLSNISQFTRFKGNYVLVGCIAKLDKHNKVYWLMQFSDISATIKVYYFADELDISTLTANQLIHIEATVKTHGNNQYIHCVCIEPIARHISLRNLSIELLPRYFCPIPSLLPRLKYLFDAIQSKSLRKFVATVLTEQTIGYRYLQCPASLRHHHAYAGGLLAHSIEVAEQILKNAEFNVQERDLGIVAGLLHDIGKVLTLTPQGSRTALGKVVDHDELTLEICAPALKILDTENSFNAMMLRHLWTCASPNARYGYQAVTPIARVLQLADNSSAKNKFTSPSNLGFYQVSPAIFSLGT